MAHFVCDECGKTFFRRSFLATHFRRHYLEKIAADKKKTEDKTDFQCEWCREYFVSQLHLDQHTQLIHKRKRFRCDFCSFSSNHSDSLKNHEIAKHRPMWKEHRCLYCGALFARKCNLQSHEIMHTGEFPVICHQCGKGFHCESHLKQHRPTHKKKSTVSIRKKPGFKCDKCLEVFAQSVFLKQHKARKHPNKKFPCEDCEYSTDQKCTLKRHRQARHLNGVQKKYQCQECGKQFSFPSGLQVHGSVHTKQKPFICKDCGKSFARKSDLSRHDHSVHMKEKPYVCGECGESFSRKEQLSAHQEAEKGEKVECGLCDGKMFPSKISLRNHLHRMHRNQQWYKCQLCPMGLTTKWNLKQHEENHRKKPIQFD